MDGFIVNASDGNDSDTTDPTLYYLIHNDFDASSQHTTRDNTMNQNQSSTATNKNVSQHSNPPSTSLSTSKKSYRFKMYSRDELPEQGYRRGVGYRPNILNDDQTRTFNQRFHLIRRKGVYPYNYFTDFNKFNETSLPPKSMN